MGRVVDGRCRRTAGGGSAGHGLGSNGNFREAVTVAAHSAAGDGAGAEGTMTALGAPVPAPGNGQRAPVAITVAGLTKNYGEIEAVRGIDFEVATGETFGFL